MMVDCSTLELFEYPIWIHNRVFKTTPAAHMHAHPSGEGHFLTRLTICSSILLAMPFTANGLCVTLCFRIINLAYFAVIQADNGAAKPFFGFTWVGININRTMKVIVNVLIRYDDNIVSKRINGKNLNNLTNRS